MISPNSKLIPQTVKSCNMLHNHSRAASYFPLFKHSHSWTETDLLLPLANKKHDIHAFRMIICLHRPITATILYLDTLFEFILLQLVDAIFMHHLL